jgi:transcriptional regulator with XRE-family HTH domain
MDRKSFGGLINILREERNITIDDLADAVYLSRTALQNLLHGKRKSVSDIHVLLRLAETLQLTKMERREFFFAALGLGMQQIVHPQEDVFDLNELLDDVKNLQTPAFVNDCYGEIVAGNNVAMNFFNVAPEFIAIASKLEVGFNVMSFICSEESGFSSLVGERWNKTILRNMLFFRRITFRYRHEERFKRILKALKELEKFKEYWEKTAGSDDDSDSNYEYYEYKHPVLNEFVKYLSLEFSGD